MSKTKQATDKWAHEVDEATSHLIEQGVSPWKARIEAVEVVRENRRRKRLDEASSLDKVAKSMAQQVVKGKK